MTTKCTQSCTMNSLLLLLGVFVCLSVAVPVAPVQWTAQVTGHSYEPAKGKQYAGFWAFDGLGGREYINGVIVLIFNFYLFLTFTRTSPQQVAYRMIITQHCLCAMPTKQRYLGMLMMITCCYGDGYDGGGCGCALINIFIYLQISTNVGSCSLGNTTGT